MKARSDILYRIPFYALLQGIYPVLFFWSMNFDQVPAFVVLRPLIQGLIVAAGVYLVAYLVFRNLRKAAALAGMLLFIVFFYGHIYNLIQGWKIFGLLIGRHITIWVVWGALCAAATVLLVRTRSDLRTLTWSLNLLWVFLVAIVLIPLGSKAWTDQRNVASGASTAAASISNVNVSPAKADSPDVYYILSDGYDRSDLMLDDIGYDNSAFIGQLESLGFIIPDCSQTNYNTTVFSVSATFNMNYLDQIGYDYQKLSQASGDMSSPGIDVAIADNPVMQIFQKMGYQVITLHEPYPFINFPHSDVVYNYNLGSNPLEKIETLRFQYEFLKTTILQELIQEAANNPEKFANLPTWALEYINPELTDKNVNTLYQTYQQDLYQLNQLDTIAQVPGKKFLYAHLMVTHPDFAFTADGQMRSPGKESKDGYRDQVIYANQRLLTTVKNILAESKTPPIIILQGDHGYGLNGRGVEQFKALNAYYLPGAGKDKLYPSITPVNTFRLILSTYFGLDYPFIQDQSIWIHAGFPGGYQKEAGTCISAQNK
jgi:hypothetical protein